MNAGKRFEDKFKQSCEGFVLRVPNKMFKRQDGQAQGVESEADFVVIANDNAFLVECKATCEKRLELRKVQEHQEEALMEFELSSSLAHGIVAVEFYDKEGYRKPKRMFLIPIQDWMAFKETTARKSIPLGIVEEIGIECQYRKNRYDIDWEALCR